MSDARDRFARALGGSVVGPPARGLSFVDPLLLPQADGVASEPAGALAAACAGAQLDFAFVPSWRPWAMDAAVALGAAGIAVLWVVQGVLSPTLARLGSGEAMRAIINDPERLAGELDESAAMASGAIAAAMIADADAIVVADDLAGAGGPIAAPSFLEAVVFPHLAGLARHAGAVGLRSVLHCDGDARTLLGAAGAAGFLAVHGDCGGAGHVGGALAAARSAGLVLIGGIPTASLGDAVSAAEAGATAAAMAAGGGLLVCDDGGAATAAECAALLAALAAARGA